MKTGLSLLSRSAAGTLLLAAAAAAGAAGPRVADVPPVQAVLLSFDCTERALPPMGKVGAILGEHNLGQAYASRARLMGDVGRACQRPGIARVDVVLRPAPAPGAADRHLAMLEPRVR